MINSVLNFTGNKFKLLNQILPEFDYTKSTFIDLFTGSFVVSANVLDRYGKVIANDIIEELIGIHKGILQSDDIIINTINICPNKEDRNGFANLRNSFNENKSPEKLWALLLSSTNNMMRFNKSFKYNQTWGKRSWNSSTDKKVEEFKNHIRKYRDKIQFTSNNFNDFIVNEPSMVYIDPPYGYIINKDSNIGNKQISEAGYNCYYEQNDDIKLYEYCKNLDRNGSSFMISGVLQHSENTSWLLNKLIKDGFKYKILKCDYNKVSRNGKKETIEVIIMNY